MAAAQSSLGEEIREELSCSICLELFTRPKVLPCQHTFCQDCLQKHVRNKKHLKCPNCRQQVDLSPQGVADREGNLWMVGRVEYEDEFAVQFNRHGRMLRKFKLQGTKWMRGIAVDTRRNHILITQTTGDKKGSKHGEVLVFRPDGTLVRTVGRDCSWRGWFASLFWQQTIPMKHPHFVTVDGDGRILVTDADSRCVFVYKENGQFLFQFGGDGSGEGQLKDPRGICTDRADNIIVADRGNSRVDMFDKTGRFLKHIATGMSPWGVAMGPQGQLIVTYCDGNAIIQNGIQYSNQDQRDKIDKGEMAYSNLSQHDKAKESYQKALELDPDNVTYQTNLRLAEQKLREINLGGPGMGGPGPGLGGMGGLPGGLGGLGGMGGGGLGGMDLGGLLNNPMLMNMATQMMQNPQMQQMLGNLLGSGGAPTQAPSSGEAPEGPEGLNMSEFLQAGQQMAQQIQQQNPDLVEQLRTQMGRDPPDGNPDNPDGKPGQMRNDENQGE
ncbi:TRIM3 [Branchiostoma lanceolatum]|uniref:RING-type E3 ubiquitin transferase n=1 Tax=Branchiostoma lanceolatum TaxID=7740 RepID=A0A8K0E7U8_BRALA|nr:TRIM3 [Branchiostoma lanceolatum]